MSNLYIISGANGSGKTTTAMTILPQFLKVMEFVNADEIAKGISPFNPKLSDTVYLHNIDLMVFYFVYVFYNVKLFFDTLFHIILNQSSYPQKDQIRPYKCQYYH